MIFMKLYWAASRLLFLLLVIVGVLTGGLLIFAAGPLYSWYFLGDWRFGRYRRLVLPTVMLAYRMFADWIQEPAYRSSFFPSIMAPPRSAPDPSLVQVRPDWSQADSSCNGCVQCCLMRACPMMDKGRKMCLGFNSFYWRYFNCGRYPESLLQIEYYNCPKWEPAKTGND
jgi:hypothetical protein